MDQDDYLECAQRQLGAYFPMREAVWLATHEWRAVAYYNPDPVGYASMPLEIVYGAAGARPAIRFTLPADDQRVARDTPGLREFAREFLADDDLVVQRRARLVRYLSADHARAVEFHFRRMRADTVDPDDYVLN